jgi:hypothetical protein
LATQVQTKSGKVLIEQMEHLPSPGERVIVGNTTYTVSDDSPYTKFIERGGPGFDKYMQVVTVNDPSREGRPGRGAAVRG